MQFVKYHGTGNDFIVPLDPVPAGELPALARRLCHRQFGFGADGLLVPTASEQAEIRMLYFNQDGTPAPMCGNGLRCFARHVHETGLVRKTEFTVETGAGILTVDVSAGYEEIRVEIGTPVFAVEPPDTIRPVPSGEVLELEAGSRRHELEILVMGTLHAVAFTCGDIPEAEADALCHHPFFPRRINVNFVQVQDRTHLTVRTYERGVGYTWSCGTGVCAAVAVASRRGLIEGTAQVNVPGGSLTVETGERYWLTGPAVRIGKGEMEIETC